MCVSTIFQAKYAIFPPKIFENHSFWLNCWWFVMKFIDFLWAKTTFYKPKMDVCEYRFPSEIRHFSSKTLRKLFFLTQFLMICHEIYRLFISKNDFLQAKNRCVWAPLPKQNTPSTLQNSSKTIHFDSIVDDLSWNLLTFYEQKRRFTSQKWMCVSTVFQAKYVISPPKLFENYSFWLNFWWFVMKFIDSL